jgi:hypothetical protein
MDPPFRLTDQQVHVLRHYDITHNHEPIAAAYLFQHG